MINEREKDKFDKELKKPEGKKEEFEKKKDPIYNSFQNIYEKETPESQGADPSRPPGGVGTDYVIDNPDHTKKKQCLVCFKTIERYGPQGQVEEVVRYRCRHKDNLLYTEKDVYHNLGLVSQKDAFNDDTAKSLEIEKVGRTLDTNGFSAELALTLVPVTNTITHPRLGKEYRTTIMYNRNQSAVAVVEFLKTHIFTFQPNHVKYKVKKYSIQDKKMRKSTGHFG